MKPGLIIDKTYAGPVETVFQQTWIEISPEEIQTSTWRPGVLKNLKDRQRHDVISFRCTECGLLHSYAT
jgi:hypothetical protein